MYWLKKNGGKKYEQKRYGLGGELCDLVGGRRAHVVSARSDELPEDITAVGAGRKTLQDLTASKFFQARSRLVSAEERQGVDEDLEEWVDADYRSQVLSLSIVLQAN